MQIDFIFYLVYTDIILWSGERQQSLEIEHKHDNYCHVKTRTVQRMISLLSYYLSMLASSSVEWSRLSLQVIPIEHLPISPKYTHQNIRG